MKILLACEFYHPSRGGVQEVMRQIAEGLVRRGHEVTVATTRLAARTDSIINGVKIEEFDVSGNLVSGMHGEIERYRDFLAQSDADAVLIKAAQQWTFDAAWPVLQDMKARKIFIPCGFSGFYLSQFEDYFRQMPSVLRQFDHLVFYAEQYRDIDFARAHALTQLSVLPNGASAQEFGCPRDPDFRARHGIGEHDLLLLSVGTPVKAKGHIDVAKAFLQLDLRQRAATLLLNGQWPEAVAEPSQTGMIMKSRAAKPNLCRRGLTHLQTRSFRSFLKTLASWTAYRAAGVLGMAQRFLKLFYNVCTRAINSAVHRAGLSMQLSEVMTDDIDSAVAAAWQQPSKTIQTVNLPRDELVQAFLHADLFVFASKIEYSPLVLFEAAASATPFLTVPVGNAEEIIAMTGGGLLCPASRDKHGYVDTDVDALAAHMQHMIDDDDLRHRLGQAGHAAWKAHYTWDAIVDRYEAILQNDDDLRKIA